MLPKVHAKGTIKKLRETRRCWFEGESVEGVNSKMDLRGKLKVSEGRDWCRHNSVSRGFYS